MESSVDKSHDVDSDACEEKLKKLKIKLGKDKTGRITSGKIISERNEDWRKNQSPHREVSVEKYQLPVDPEDAFHGFPDSSVPDWVSDNFNGVDLKSNFNLKRFCCISIRSSKNRQKQQQQAVPSDKSQVSVKSEPLKVEAPNLQKVDQLENPKLSMAVPNNNTLGLEQPSLSKIKGRKRGPREEVCGVSENGFVKEDPPAKYRRRKTRFENLSSHSSKIRISFMPKSMTFVALKDFIPTEPEAPPLFNTAAMAKWVEDEVKKDSSPMPWSQSSSPAQPPSSPLPASGGNNTEKRIPAEVSSSLVSSSSSHHQKAGEVSRLNKSLPREVSSYNNDSDEGQNPGDETGLGAEPVCCPTSVIVANPAQAAKYQDSSYQLSDEVMDNSCEVVNLTDDSVDLDKEDTPDGEVIIVKEISLQLNGRRGIVPAQGRTDNFNPGVAISLVIPANNNRNNTELKIKLNQSQVDELRNCLKEI